MQSARISEALRTRVMCLAAGNPATPLVPTYAGLRSLRHSLFLRHPMLKHAHALANTVGDAHAGLGAVVEPNHCRLVGGNQLIAVTVKQALLQLQAAVANATGAGSNFNGRREMQL